MLLGDSSLFVAVLIGVANSLVSFIQFKNYLPDLKSVWYTLHLFSGSFSFAKLSCTLISLLGVSKISVLICVERFGLNTDFDFFWLSELFSV